MKYTLTKTKQTRKYDIYDLPDSVKYNGKTYNMRHPCQLMISLKKDMVLKEKCYYIEFWEYDVYNNRNNIIEVMKGYVK